MKILGSLPAKTGFNRVSVIDTSQAFTQNAIFPESSIWWNYYQHGKTYTHQNQWYTLVNVVGKGGFVGFLSKEAQTDRIEGDLKITIDGVEEIISIYGNSSNETGKRFYFGYLDSNGEVNYRRIPCTRAAYALGLCDKFESSLKVEFYPKYATSLNLLDFASGAFYHLVGDGIL